MKKFVCSLILLAVIFTFSACSEQSRQNEQSEEAVSSEYALSDEEVSRLLESDEIPNTEKISVIKDLSDEQYAEAEQYRELIKQFFEESVNESVFFQDKDYPIDDAKKSVDDYCDYLRDEYNANIDFFQNCADIKYEGGTAAGFYLAWNEYECAEDYADKIKAVYEDLINLTKE